MPNYEEMLDEIKQVQGRMPERRALYEKFLAALPEVFDELKKRGIELVTFASDVETFDLLERKYRFKMKSDITEPASWRIQLDRLDIVELQGPAKWSTIGSIDVDAKGNARLQEGDATALKGFNNLTEVYHIVLSWLFAAVTCEPQT